MYRFSKIISFLYLISLGVKLIEYIQKNIEKIFDKVPFDIPRVDVVRCKYRNDANLIGALYNFLGLKNN